MNLLFDIGGTKMRLALASRKKAFGNYMIIPTPKDFKTGIKVLEETVMKMTKGKGIELIVGGIAGTLDKQKNSLVSSPNLSAWVGKQLKKTLKKIFGAPVYIMNDAAVAGLGEYSHSNKRCKIMAYLTISTGVGGVRIVDGQIDANYFGFEPGQQIINFGKIRTTKNVFTSNLEDYISGTALAKKYNKPSANIRDQKIWDQVTYLLAVGLHNTIIHWSPEVVVLGGSVTKSISLARVKYYLKKINKRYPEVPLIKKSTLGDLNGLYGAAYSAKLIKLKKFKKILH